MSLIDIEEKMELKPNESFCPRDGTLLEQVADRTEDNYTKDVVELTQKEKDDNPDIKTKDEKHFRVTKMNLVKRPCYCWRCSVCGLEMTITK